MAYRFTDTNKWNDKWFLDLRPVEKLLFNYLCDNCDCSGFIEVNQKKWSDEIGYNKRDIEGALEGLARGLFYSLDNEIIYLRTFLKHQKHYPLNPKDNFYKGIINRFENYRHRFEIQDIDEFITRGLQGAFEGLRREKGIGIDKGIVKDKILTWRTSIDIYKKEEKEFYDNLIIDSEFLKTQEKFYPNIDILLTLEKAHSQFWHTEAGWKNKKLSKSDKIDWKKTYINSLSNKLNHVWKNKKTNSANCDYDAEEKKALEILGK